MKYPKPTRSASGAAALLVFALFSLSVIAVLLGGARIYRGLTRRDSAAYNLRTCQQYLATRVRQAPSPDAVGVGVFENADTLEITQDIDGTTYLTRIYCHNGWLMELFSVADGTFSPEDGEKILPLEQFSVSRGGTLLTCSLGDSAGQHHTVTLSIRGGGTP